MKFTYSDYTTLIDLLKKHQYTFTDYASFNRQKREVIMRHDIDYDIQKSLTLAEMETDLGVASTYFVLLTTDFYNVFSRRNVDMLRKIAAMGHHVGLHFDEMNCPEIAGDQEKVVGAIAKEAHLLEDALDIPIRSFSYHRPSQSILQANLEIPGLINSYSDVFFHDFKYLSDSRRRWREPVEDIISSNRYDRLHILTHAFWYDKDEKALSDSLREFIDKACVDRHETLNNNFSGLDEAIGK